MPKILKARRIHNSGRKKKRMSAKQIRFFGTKRQRAALKSRPKRKNRARRRNFPARSRILSWSKGRGKAVPVRRHRNSGRRRRAKRKNVGEILTASLSGLNPGRKKMARRRVRRHRTSNRRRRVRAMNPRRRRRTVVHHRRRRRTSNPRVVVRYRGRRHNRVRGRRRNPGFLSGKAGKVVGVLGGAALTSIMSGFIPAQFNTGIMGYFATGIVAYAQGKIIGKVTKSPALGDDMFIGGLAYLALKVISDMVPSIAGFLPFKLGQIAPNSFYIPQVPVPGSMSSFMVPSAIPTMVAQAGMGATRGRRVGRMGY